MPDINKAVKKAENMIFNLDYSDLGLTINNVYIRGDFSYMILDYDKPKNPKKSEPVSQTLFGICYKIEEAGIIHFVYDLDTKWTNPIKVEIDAIGKDFIKACK